MAAAMQRILEDQKLRLKLIEEGMKTAWSYTWEGVTRDFSRLILERLS